MPPASSVSSTTNVSPDGSIVERRRYRLDAPVDVEDRDAVREADACRVLADRRAQLVWQGSSGRVGWSGSQP
jgi:hypothetical protein